MTELEAVNVMLQQAGQYRVTAIENGGASLSATAKTILDQVELEVQTEGWHFNIFEKQQLTPDGDGYIAVPAGTLEIDTDDSSSHINVKQMGGWLYNLDDQTKVFSNPISCEIRKRLAWGCIPEPIRQYIAHEAAARFNHSYGSDKKQRRIEEDAAKKKIKARQADTRTSDVSLLDAPDIIEKRGGRTRAGYGSAIPPIGGR